MKSKWYRPGKIIRIDSILTNDEDYLSIIKNEVREKINGIYSNPVVNMKIFRQQLDAFIISLTNKVFQMREMFIKENWFPDQKRDIFKLNIIFIYDDKINDEHKTSFTYVLENTFIPVTAIYGMDMKPIKKLEQYTKTTSKTEMEFFIEVMRKNKKENADESN